MQSRRLYVRLLWIAFLFLSARSWSQITDVAVSADGKVLAITRTSKQGSFIYLVSSATGGATRLTLAKTGWENSPSFSPDGTRIAYSFAASESSSFRIIIQSLIDGTRREFPTTGEDEYSPVLGRKVVLFRKSNFYGSYSPIARPHQHEWDFFRRDFDGKNVLQVTNERFYFASRPSVSGDGTKMIAAVETLHSGRTLNVYALNSPDTPVKRLRPNGNGIPKRDAIYNSPNFLQDGRSVLFLAASGHFVFDYDVYQMDIGTSSCIRLTHGNGYSSGLSVSANGTTAAFLKWRSDRRGTPIESKVVLLDVQNRSTRELAISGLE